MGKIKEFFKEKVEDFVDFEEEHPVVYFLGCFTIGTIIGQYIVNNKVARKLDKLEKDTRYLHDNDKSQLALLDDVAKLNGKKLTGVMKGTDDIGLGIYGYELVDIQTESKENAD